MLDEEALIADNEGKFNPSENIDNAQHQFRINTKVSHQADNKIKQNREVNKIEKEMMVE